VESLAHPGGNVTGFLTFEPSLAGKWPELLIEIKPDMRTVRILYNPDTAPGSSYFLELFEAAATLLGLQPSLLPVRSIEEIDSRRTFISSLTGQRLSPAPPGTGCRRSTRFPILHRKVGSCPMG
jgi:putative ABC transport system substrate-binding protein